MTTVIINGAFGKMGTTSSQTIEASKKFQLIKRLGRQDNLFSSINELKPELVIDFTNANCVYDNAKILINNKTKAIIGASGLTESQITHLSELCITNKTGCIVAPNFSLGAILMMKFSAIAASYFSEAEIIETHHQQKLDAPSGTATKTAKLIDASRRTSKNAYKSKEFIAGARGAISSNTNIHSLRLPGFLASQQVVFGSPGENLTLQHNSISRDCFMPGLLLACNKVLNLNHLIYGLENLLD